MAEMRIQMAGEAEANIIVTSYPFCLKHFEDGVKTGGLNNELKAIDLAEPIMSAL